MKTYTTLEPLLYKNLVQQALLEDLGHGGDLTSSSTIDENRSGTAHLISRADGILAGLDLAKDAFLQINPQTDFTANFKDGDQIGKGDIIAEIQGSVRHILTAERTALNFLGHLCGIASLTAQMVIAARPHKAKIAATRKTTPLLRSIEKYAVRLGGGIPHRYRLDDCIMIKDNHIAANNGDIKKTLERARAYAGHTVKIEIEVDHISQFKEILDIGIAEIILLDNMTPAEMAEIVALNQGRFLLEASGNVNINTVQSIAASGVDIISIGALTHSAANFDIGLDF